MKKKLLIFILLIFLMAFVAACGDDKSSNGSSEDGKVQGEITFITNRTDLVDTFYKDAIKKFKEKYPDVTDVNIEALKDYEGDIKVRLASGEYGDMLLVPPSLARDEYSQFFSPLDDLDLQGKIEFEDEFSYDNHLYGVTSGVNAKGIVYNKKAFEKAGIKDVPKTLDELYADAKKLKEAGVVPLATNFKDAWPLQHWDDFATLIARDGGYRNSLVDQKAPFSLDEPYGKSFDVLNTFIENGWTEKDLMGTDWESSKTKVANGEYGMYFLANWVIPQLIDQGGAKPENIGFMPFPVDDSGKLITLMSNDWAYAVNKNSENAATAKAFLKFMVEDSGYQDENGFLPTMKGKDSELPQIKEFMSYDPEVLYPEPTDPKVNKIANEAKIDFLAGVIFKS